MTQKIPLYFVSFLILSFFISLPAFSFFYFLPKQKPNKKISVLGAKTYRVNSFKIEEKTTNLFEIQTTIKGKNKKELKKDSFFGKKAIVIKGTNVLAEITGKTLNIYNLNNQEKLVKILVY